MRTMTSNATVGSTSVISTATSSNNSSTTITLLQAFFKARGWDDEIGGKIYHAEVEQNNQEQRLRSAIEVYLEEPTDTDKRSRATQALREARQIARSEYDYAVKQQARYQQLIAAKSTQPAKTQTWMEYLFGWGIETDQDQVEKYAEVAENRINTIQQLSEVIDVLEAEAQSADEIVESQTTVTSTPVKGQFPPVVSLDNLNGAGVEFLGRSGETTGIALSGTEGVDVFGDGPKQMTPGLIIESKDTQLTQHAFLIKGGPQISAQSPFSLDTINGTNGVRLDGVEPNQLTSDFGASVGAGNILPGKAPAVMVGAYDYDNGKGRTSVVPASALKNISSLSLNDSSVIQIDGQNPNDYSSFPVSAADLNKDGQDELVVSSENFPGTSIGRVSVVPNVGKQNPLSLGDPSVIQFNGNDAKPDYTGISTDSKGDVNKDGTLDLVATTFSGATAYAVYGGNWIDKAQNISLPSIGVQGHGTVIQGKPPTGSSFSSVTTGDVNGDGASDVILSVPAEGAVSVIFGSTNLPPMVDRTQLTGKNGFTMTGINGTSVSHSGVASTDVNGDKIDDIIIGSPNQDVSGAGETFVVFGQPQIGSNGTFSLSTLNGANGFRITGRAAKDQSGGVVRRIGDLNSDGVKDFAVSSTGRNQVDVIFGDIPPVLNMNNFTIFFNESTVVTPGMLSASSYHNDTDVRFSVTNIPPGTQFMRGNTTTTDFTQAEVLAGNISILNNNLTVTPYSIGVRTSGLAYVPPTPSAVTLRSRPVVTKDSLKLKQGDTVKVTSENITASQPGSNNSKLTYKVSNVQHGQFMVNSTSVSQFSDVQLASGFVQFEQDDEPSAPNYTLTVSGSDGLVSNPSYPVIDFVSRPQMTKPYVKISPPDQILMTAANFYAFDPSKQVNESGLLYAASDLGNCYFTVAGEEKTNFTQEDVSAGYVVFHANSSDKPGFKLSVSAEGFECKGCPEEADVEVEGDNETNERDYVRDAAIVGSLIAAITLACCVGRGASKPKDAYEEVADTLKAYFYVGVYYRLCCDRCTPGYTHIAKTIVDGIRVLPPMEIKDDYRLLDENEPQPPHEMKQDVERKEQPVPLQFALNSFTPSEKARFKSVVEQKAAAVLGVKHTSCCGRLFCLSPKQTDLKRAALSIKNDILAEYKDLNDTSSQVRLVGP